MGMKNAVPTNEDRRSTSVLWLIIRAARNDLTCDDLESLSEIFDDIGGFLKGPFLVAILFGFGFLLLYFVLHP